MNIVSIVALAITSVISLIAVCISAWSLKVSKENLRLNLYTKRFDIYSKVMKYALWFAHKNRGLKELEDSVIKENFILAFRESQFLFDKSTGVYELIEEIKDKCAKIIFYESQDSKNSADPHQKMVDIKLSIEPILKKLEEAMRQYLDFGYLYFK